MTVCKSSRVCVRFFSSSVVRMFKARRSTESLLIRSAALLRASCVMFVAVSVRSFRTKASVSASICACCSCCSLMDIFANSAAVMISFRSGRIKFIKLLVGGSRISQSQLSVFAIWWSTFAANAGGPSIIVYAAMVAISLYGISKKVSKLFGRSTTWLWWCSFVISQYRTRKGRVVSVMIHLLKAAGRSPKMRLARNSRLLLIFAMMGVMSCTLWCFNHCSSLLASLVIIPVIFSLYWLTCVSALITSSLYSGWPVNSAIVVRVKLFRTLLGPVVLVGSSSFLMAAFLLLMDLDALVAASARSLINSCNEINCG
mmetsp:Transcript_10022/g.14473  ORF Transcript_10022/g.14473 Transcript_10022/m.14473 type:complete len:314 (-) Transcript_10022:2336-3277(-)